MQRRHQTLNVPTELARTLVVLSETKSFSQTGQRLGLSQPAISAQVKKLQTIVGGPLLRRTVEGTLLNERGARIVGFARKMIQANEQILLLGGRFGNAAPLRVGLENDFVECFFSIWKKLDLDGEICFHCDAAAELRAALTGGYLDIACLQTAPEDCETLDAWQEDYIWTRAGAFTFMPGTPIPIVTGKTTTAHMLAVDSLERAGAIYRIVFTGDDLQSRLDAVACGLGIMAMPARLLKAPLIRSEEDYLPKIRAPMVSLCTRKGLSHRHKTAVLEALRSLRVETPLPRIKQAS
jgi:DNA-binding transcriptional LysR family regulator